MAGENIIYQDLILTNTSPAPVLARILQTRTTPIVDRPMDYELQVQRMQVSLREVPLFFPDIPNPAFPLQTDMSITLSFGGVFFRQFINVTTQEAKVGVFSYQNYLNDLNAASTAAFVALKAAFPGAAPTAPPLFFINPQTALISMYVQDGYLNTNPNRILIGFNQVLQQIMALPFDLTFPIPDPNGFEYLISVNNSGILLPAAPRTGVPAAVSAIAGNLLQVQQEYISTDEWDSVKSIVILSSLIPTAKEFVPTNTSSGQSSSLSSGSLGILIDFELVKSNPFEPRHIAQYIPQSEFIMKSLNGSSPLNQIDAQAFYQTYNGRLFEIYLGNNTNLSLKLMFRRKREI
jgi:hypothetical protein